VLSVSSPLGEALLGKKVDEQASYETPRGATVSVTVTAIRPAE
jgi:transcription elongation factor GreA